MAHDAPQATGPSKLVIRNIGLVLSGALEKPILDADTIVAENGKITAIGRLKDVNTGGVTTMISAGEVHMPGRPRDVVGVKAMAIFAQRAFWNLRPGGVKIHAGAPVIECE